jgi:hypothetical protein
MESALYEGRVLHSRQLAPRHAFTKRLYLLYLDLAELDRVFAGRWLWGVERGRGSRASGGPIISAIPRSPSTAWCATSCSSGPGARSRDRSGC